MHVCTSCHTQTHSRLNIDVSIHTHELILSLLSVSAGSEKSYSDILPLVFESVLRPSVAEFKLRTKKHLLWRSSNVLDVLLTAAQLHTNREGLNTPQRGKKSFSTINCAADCVIIKGLMYILSVYLFISKYGCSFAAGVDC